MIVAHVGGIPLEETLAAGGPALLTALGAGRGAAPRPAAPQALDGASRGEKWIVCPMCACRAARTVGDNQLPISGGAMQLLTRHPRLLFAVVSIVAFLAPSATATAKLAGNHNETMLIDA
jgi:hypothetical protein